MNKLIMNVLPVFYLCAGVTMSGLSHAGYLDGKRIKSGGYVFDTCYSDAGDWISEQELRKAGATNWCSKASTQKLDSILGKNAKANFNKNYVFTRLQRPWAQSKNVYDYAAVDVRTKEVWVLPLGTVTQNPPKLQFGMTSNKVCVADPKVEFSNDGHRRFVSGEAMDDGKLCFFLKPNNDKEFKMRWSDSSGYSY